MDVIAPQSLEFRDAEHLSPCALQLKLRRIRSPHLLGEPAYVRFRLLGFFSPLDFESLDTDFASDDFDSLFDSDFDSDFVSDLDSVFDSLAGLSFSAAFLYESLR